MIDLRQPRDLGGILNACYLLYREHFRVFAAIAVTVVAPLNVITVGLMDGRLTSGFDSDDIFSRGPAYTIVQALVTVPLITAGHVNAVMDAGAGRALSAQRALSAAGAVLVSVMATVLLAALGVVLGVLALILPGIYLGVRWYVAAESVVAEELSPVAALRRSGELVTGNWWRVLGIAIVLNLLAALPAYLLAAPLEVAAYVANVGALSVLGSIVADTILLSFVALSGTILYFDLRARHADAAAAASGPPPPEPEPLERPEVPPGA